MSNVDPAVFGDIVALMLIETQIQFDLMVKELSGASVIALDVESASSLHHYVNRVCVIQLAARGRVFVVDAICGIDLSPLGRILEDPAIEIIMHDTDFDLRSLDHDYGWHPRNLFDTLIAARLCGIKEFGLAKLLERYFGIRGSKKFQRADWTIRPLPRELVEYAAADVAELVRLRDVLAGELEGLGRMKWARAEFAQCEGKRFIPDERPLFARVKKARELCSGRDLAVLKELAELRDEIARALDLPLFMVVGDGPLVELARRPPATVAELVSRRGMHPACKKKYAGRFIDAVLKGLKAPELKWPRQGRGERRGNYSLAVFDALKSWRADFGASIGVEPDLVLSMDSLRRLAGGQAIDEVLALEPVSVWRGEEIKKALGAAMSKVKR